MMRVKPDNGHLIDKTKTKLVQLKVKIFNFSIINMLTKLMNLVDKIGNLGGMISIEDQAFHFWQSAKTMKEQRFSYYCDGEHDRYWAAVGTAKPTLSSLIEQFKAKKVNKKRENLWNKPTPEQAQILSLVAMIQGNGNGFKGSSKGKGGKGSKNSSNETNNSRSKKKDRGVKQWMLEAPKDGAPKSITKNKKEYHWCPKCVKDKGQWVRHNPSDHLENFKTKKKSDNNGRGSSGTSKAKGKKSSNASRGGPPGGGGSSGSSSNSLCFNWAALLSVAAGNNVDTQAFLSQFVPGKE